MHPNAQTLQLWQKPRKFSSNFKFNLIGHIRSFASHKNKAGSFIIHEKTNAALKQLFDFSSAKF